MKFSWSIKFISTFQNMFASCRNCSNKLQQINPVSLEGCNNVTSTRGLNWVELCLRLSLIKDYISKEYI